MTKKSLYRDEDLGEGDCPLSEIELAAPVEDALTQSGIKTLGALGSMSYLEILALPGVDMSGVAQIKRRLEILGPSQEPSRRATTRLRSTSAQPKEGSQALTKEQRPAPEDELTSTSLRSSESRACKSIAGGHSKTDSSPTTNETIDSPIPLLETLNLSTRAHNALRRAGHNTIADIASLTDKDLLDIRQVGVNTLAEIRSELKAYLNSYHEPVSSPMTDLDPSPILEFRQSVRSSMSVELGNVL